MVKYNVSNKTAFITLNWKEKRNALGPELVFELRKYVKKANDDDDVKLISITGSENVFSAGADLSHLKALNKFSDEENIKDSESLKNLFLDIYLSKKIVVAVVNGHAIAGGCGLATVCDIVLASDKAKLGYTEVKIGFVAAIVMVFLKTMIPEKKALDLLFTGRLITAREAEQIGIVTKVFDDDQLDTESLKYFDELLKNSPNSLMETKKMFKSINIEQLELDLNKAVNLNASMRKTKECQEGINAFLEKRQPEW